MHLVGKPYPVANVSGQKAPAKKRRRNAVLFVGQIYCIGEVHFSGLAHSLDADRQTGEFMRYALFGRPKSLLIIGCIIGRARPALPADR